MYHSSLHSLQEENIKSIVSPAQTFWLLVLINKIESLLSTIASASSTCNSLFPVDKDETPFLLIWGVTSSILFFGSEIGFLI